TGLTLAVLGFGGAALPATWGNPLSRAGRVELVRYAVERGIRYFDTAPGSYMESQAILGEALKDLRKRVCLVTKVDTTEPSEVRRSVEGSLRELQTDYGDIVLIHGTPGLEQMTVPQAMKVHAELAKLRDERVIRIIGFSAHSYFDKALALIESGGFGLCMLAYGYIPRGYNQIWSARMAELRNACVARAHERGMGIVAMKVVGAGMLGAWAPHIVPGFDKGRLAGLPGAAIRWTLQDDRVHMLCIGMRLKPEIDASIAILTGRTALTPQDRALLAEFSKELYETSAMKQLRID
ncbi:MAG: aldo/keto reductase, partial [Armatimonadetes bacterium]|nr:aldo/keto reductase [Armatimonadota bacterium]